MRRDETSLRQRKLSKRNLSRNQNEKQANQTREISRQVWLISKLEYKVLLYVFKYYGVLNTNEWRGGAIRALGLARRQFRAWPRDRIEC